MIEQIRKERDKQDQEQLVETLQRMTQRANEKRDVWIRHSGYEELPENLLPNSETIEAMNSCYEWYSLSMFAKRVLMVPDIGKIELYIENDDGLLLLARAHHDDMPVSGLNTLYNLVRQIAAQDPDSLKRMFMAEYCSDRDFSEEELFEVIHDLQEEKKIAGN